MKQRHWQALEYMSRQADIGRVDTREDRFPRGIGWATLDNLVDAGLASRNHYGFAWWFSITTAGVLALEDHERGESGG